MQTPPPLTDRAALLRNRGRAKSMTNPAMFLHQAAVIEVQERLGLVNRTFTQAAIVTGFPEEWRDVVPGAALVDDTETLDIQVGKHDLVVHALSLHWANDPVGQLVQARRALAPDGLFIGVLLGGKSLHELRSTLAEAETALRGGLSPRVVPMGEIRDLGSLLQRAGFALPVADAVTITATYQNAYDLMRDLRAMGETNAMTARTRTHATRALFDDAAARYMADFETEGRIKATFEMIFLAGWAPDDSQQKPLRPGSAKARLADSLGTAEVSLPDTQHD